MLRIKSSLIGSVIVLLSLAFLCLTTPLHAYVDLAPTLAKIITDSKKIALVEVVKFDRKQHILILKEVRALKGELSSEQITHDVVSAEGASIPRQVLQWAAPGERGVLFASRNTALVCVGEGWYQARMSGTGLWKIGKDRPDLPLAYYGTVSRLAEGVELMLAGKDTVLTVVAFGADNEGASFDLALNRASLPGLIKVQRIRANLQMPPMVMGASSNPAYFIGPGPVDEEDLPLLIKRLKSSDAMVRAEAADDLRCLGRKARSEAAPLAELLDDPAPRVRLSAVAALLRITPKNNRAFEVLSQCLDSTDPVVRCDAAKATGLAGSAAAPLAGKLAGFLKDDDESMRITALQAISMLGKDASLAAPAVQPLLDDPELAIDAADALGRIGAAARPALKRLTEMLSADQPAIRWAAARAMSQIGGEEAHPAVDFLVRNLPKSTEVEGYNTMIYLSLLGPVAKDAISTIRSVRIKNPVLPSATLWAIEPDKSLPWSGGGRFGMPGPGGPGGGGGPRGGDPGGGGPGGGGMGDISLFIYQSYIRELGERLRPASRALALKIMDGTAGDVPVWGYQILECGSDETLDILASHLTDDDIVMRERATVALGYMGTAAAPVSDRVKTALNKAPTDREKRLIEWCIREISQD